MSSICYNTQPIVKTSKNDNTVKLQQTREVTFYISKITKAFTWLGIEKECYLLTCNLFCDIILTYRYLTVVSLQSTVLGPHTKFPTGPALTACYVRARRLVNPSLTLLANEETRISYRFTKNLYVTLNINHVDRQRTHKTP